MVSLTVANQKGGVGKTTIVTHVAWHAASLGKSVLFIDNDPQGNASSALESSSKKVDFTTSQLYGPFDYEELTPEPGVIHLIAADALLAEMESKPLAAVDDFTAQVRHLSEPFDFVFIDVGPALGNRMLGALLATDALLTPIDPEKFAIDGVATMIHTFRHAAQMKIDANSRGASYPDMRLLGVFLAKVTRTFPRHRDTVAALADAYGELILPVHLPTRSAIGEAQSANLPVWDLNTPSSRDAAKEMRKACAYIIDLLEDTQA